MRRHNLGAAGCTEQHGNYVESRGYAMNPQSQAPLGRPYVLVVGVKFDSIGQMTIDEAVRVADGHRNAYLHLCHVVESPDSATEGPPSAGLQRLLDERAEMLQVFVLNKLVAPTNPLTERIRLHVATGDTARALVRLACDIHADAIVVGAHPDTGESGVVHGSVAVRLSEISPCSVFVVRPPSYRGLPAVAMVEADPFARSAEDDLPPSSRFRRHVRLRWVGNLASEPDHTLSR